MPTEKCALCGNRGQRAVYAFPILLREMDIPPIHGEYAHAECMIEKRIEINKYEDRDESQRSVIIESSHHFPYGRKRGQRKNAAPNRQPPNDPTD